MRYFLPVVLFILTTLSAQAERRVALVIGNTDYEIIGKLANAGEDARLISDTLRKMGFDVETVFDADEDTMGEAIDIFAAKARLADVAAVYFAGHGIQYNRANYLMPVDARLRSAAAIAREGIALDQIMQALEPVPISLIFLDACRNNPFAEQVLAQAQSEGRTAGLTRGLAVVQAQGDQLVAFATLPDTVASDGSGGNSPFALALARHIPTPGIEVSVMMKRVTADVYDKTDGAQRPQQLSQMQREFYFSPSAETSQQTLHSELEPILSVYPLSVTVNDEIAMIADLPRACTPFFFAVAPSGKFTPIPRDFFKTVGLSNGQTRYEISPGSRYGLIVLPEDEKGDHHIGYICEPPLGTDQSILKALLRQARNTATTGGPEDGVYDQSGLTVTYQMRELVIR
ncbi:MAG: caspase domain-containing protein [Rhodobacteraceae bacterium]|nr:caspase domain-containing protein [Paracoccaceae bacterium]